MKPAKNQLSLLDVPPCVTGPARLPRTPTIRHAKPASLPLVFERPRTRPAPPASRTPAARSAGEGEEPGELLFRGHRKGRHEAAALLFSVERAVGGLRRGERVEVHRDGLLLTCAAEGDALAVRWTARGIKAALLPLVTDLAREHGFFPQD